MTRLAIINEPDSGATDAEVQSWIIAVANQVANEFFDAWAIAGVDMRMADSTAPPLPDEWWVTCLKSSDVAQALGYHDLTPQGLPLAKVFVGTTIADGSQPSVCFDHEVLEMLIDPNIQLAAQNADGRMFSYEVCDAIEDDSCGYKGAGGVLLSDFVYPNWFSAQGNAPFDHTRKLTNPFTLAAGGYIGIFQNGTWSQIQADHTSKRLRARVGSRRERRAVGRANWRLSTKTF